MRAHVRLDLSKTNWQNNTNNRKKQQQNLNYSAVNDEITSSAFKAIEKFGSVLYCV